MARALVWSAADLPDPSSHTSACNSQNALVCISPWTFTSRGISLLPARPADEDASFAYQILRSMTRCIRDLEAKLIRVADVPVPSASPGVPATSLRANSVGFSIVKQQHHNDQRRSTLLSVYNLLFLRRSVPLRPVSAMNTRFTLGQSDIPMRWYNIAADLPELLPPPLHPGTRQPIGPADMAAIFPESLVVQEMSAERWVDIPAPVRHVYALWRPTPLLRAVRLEKELQTPAHIYYKYEGVSPAGSHKPNTAVAQAYYNKLAGTKRLATETGAGQWGSALALACRIFGLDCTVYMVRVSFEQKPYRKLLMQTWGAEVFPSPSNRTEFGRKVAQSDPDSPGSLGIAISEAIEDTVRSKNTKYSLGSVLNHVCLHQTVIGQEAILQMEQAGEEPDTIVACVGGGSNFAGLTFPFLEHKITKKKPYRVIAVEPSVCASLTKGELRYDFGDTAEMTPLLWMYTLGHQFIPPKIHAGGLRYHGMAPLVSQLHKLGLIEAIALPQSQVFEAAVMFARTEGIVPAPEPSHAVRVAIDEAIRAREEGKKCVILFNLCGHGLLDLTAYDAYLSGRLAE